MSLIKQDERSLPTIQLLANCMWLVESPGRKARSLNTFKLNVQSPSTYKLNVQSLSTYKLHMYRIQLILTTALRKNFTTFFKRRCVQETW